MPKLLAPLAAALLASLSGCGVKWVVEQPYEARRVCSVAVVPIAVGKSQEEYRGVYYPRFVSRFREEFAGRIRVEEWKGDRGLNWEEATAEGTKLGVDAVVGILFDDSAYPPQRIEILKVVKAQNGRVIARQNRLIPPDEEYDFRSELRKLRSILGCSKNP